MGLFDALGSLTKAVVGTALLPVDVATDVVRAVVDPDFAPEVEETATERRAKKILSNAQRAVDE